MGPWQVVCCMGDGAGASVASRAATAFVLFPPLAGAVRLVCVGSCFAPADVRTCGIVYETDKFWQW